MQHGITGPHAIRFIGLDPGHIGIALLDGDISGARTSVLVHQYLPAHAFSQQCRTGHQKYVFVRGQGDVCIDPKSFAQTRGPFRQAVEFDDHIDPLLFDPEGRYLGEGHRLDSGDLPRQKGRANTW